MCSSDLDTACRLTDRIVENALPFGDRFVSGDVGMSRRADIEQQFPGSLATCFRAPQVESSDFSQLCLQDDGDRIRLFRFARFQDSTDWWQGLDLLRINVNQLSRLVSQSRAGDIQRELDRLRDEQLKLLLCQIDFVTGFDPCRKQAQGSMCRIRRSIDADVVGSC